jgi:hypothetical protein
MYGFVFIVAIVVQEWPRLVAAWQKHGKKSAAV